MSTRFYYPNSDLAEVFINQKLLNIEGDLFHYVANVRRMRINDNLTLFDGSGCEYLCVIAEIAKKTLELKLLQVVNVNNEPEIKVNLLMSVIANDKMDYAIQKAVELGVYEITPIVSEYSQLAKIELILKKVGHWQKIIISACEQSGRSYIPHINPPVKLFSCISKLNTQENIIIADPLGIKFSELNYSKNEKVNILIGAEGGFSENEHNEFNKKNLIKVSLGKTILRAETAVVAILAKILIK